MVVEVASMPNLHAGARNVIKALIEMAEIWLTDLIEV